MKRILILTILLMSSLAWAGSTTVVVGQVSSGAEGGAAFCSSCSGTGSSPSFCWEVTADAADDVTITDGGGCSVDDTTGTDESQVEISAAPAGKTGYAVDCGSTGSVAYDRYAFSNANELILDATQGTMQFDFYVDTWGNDIILCGMENGLSIGTNSVFVSLYNNDELRFTHEGDSAGARRITTTDYNLAEDTWYTCTVKWEIGRAGGTTQSLQITGKAEQTATNTLTDVTVVSDFCVGNILGSGTTGHVYIKTGKVWKTWQA